MKKQMIALCLGISSLCSVSAMAQGFGVVDVQKIFKASPKAQAISEKLKVQFSGRRNEINKMGQDLQAEVKNYEKNQAVLPKDKLGALQKTISDHGVALRQAQAKFQSDIMEEQNKQMSGFIEQVKTAVSKVAQKHDLDVVLPNNVVLFSKPKLDVTNEVLDSLK